MSGKTTKEEPTLVSLPCSTCLRKCSKAEAKYVPVPRSKSYGRLRLAQRWDESSVISRSSYSWMSMSSSCCGGAGRWPGIGSDESIAAKDCAVGTSRNSPSGLPLSHLFWSVSVHREVRSIWQWRYHGTMTVRPATEHSSYLPSLMVRFHAPLAYSASACGTLKRWRNRRTAICSKRCMVSWFITSTTCLSRTVSMRTLMLGSPLGKASQHRPV